MNMKSEANASNPDVAKETADVNNPSDDGLEGLDSIEVAARDESSKTTPRPDEFTSIGEQYAENARTKTKATAHALRSEQQTDMLIEVLREDINRLRTAYDENKSCNYKLAEAEKRVASLEAVKLHRKVLYALTGFCTGIGTVLITAYESIGSSGIWCLTSESAYCIGIAVLIITSVLSLGVGLLN